MERPNSKKLNGISSDTVNARTGHGWDEWLKVLDKAGAKKLSHKEIALYLKEELGCSLWWSQMITVGYEQARGRRAPGQRCDGFAAGVSRTLNAPLVRLFKAWTDARLRRRWLGNAKIEIRGATAPKSMRIRWLDDDTDVDVNFYGKGRNKSQVAVQHRKLKNAELMGKCKRSWDEALKKLQTLLAPA